MLSVKLLMVNRAGGREVMRAGTETASLQRISFDGASKTAPIRDPSAAVSWMMRRDTATGQRAGPVLSLDARENKHVISPHDEQLSIGNHNTVPIMQLTGTFVNSGVGQYPGCFSFLRRCMEYQRGLATRKVSVCPFVGLSNACTVTKRKKDLSWKTSRVNMARSPARLLKNGDDKYSSEQILQEDGPSCVS